MKPYLKLTRLYLSVAIAFSAVAGYLFCNKSFNVEGLYVFVGVLLLSGGASALNQYQESKLDAIMERTQSRPLPMGILKPGKALIIGLMLALFGSLILYFGNNWITAVIGIFNLVWYNAVYTPLKRKTSYVVLIGAVTGALPPLMGWTAANGNILDPSILLVAFFMFLWQIPHFWLLLLKFGKEYEKAGFPSITSFMSVAKAKSIIFIWILGTAASTMFFPIFKIITNIPLIILLIVFNTILIYSFYKITFQEEETFKIKYAFRFLYLYQVVILLLLIMDAIF